MRDPNRIPIILTELCKVWEEHPDLRLGQLLVNAAHIAGWKNSDIFYVEDDQLRRGIEELDKWIEKSLTT